MFFASHKRRSNLLKNGKPAILSSLYQQILMEVVYKSRYQRLQRIGSGASGVIYKVKSQPEGRVLIAKHIPLFKLEKDTALQEFKILEKLKHHYIVRYQDSFEHEDELVLIMQYCGERDLAWHIDQRRQNSRHFSEYLVTNWILQLLLAVGFMHSNKILHRDLKPQNVFVDSDMNLKVGDFGISRILDTTGQHCQTSAGTPSYMAPEIVDSQQYSFKADIWSLGCIIWEICTLQRLFPLRDENDKPIGLIKMMDMIKHKQVKEIPSLYSQDLRKLVKKMLTRSPDKRPKAEDLLKDKLLVQLMINRINQKDNLKQEYPKGQDVPSLSNSLLDRQANAVKQQLRKLEEQVDVKMQGLKQRKVQKNQLQAFEKQLKKKMSEVENAVKLAFKELYSNGKFEEQGKRSADIKNSSVKSSIKNISKGTISNDSLQNSSDVTIQSVELQSNRQIKNESQLTLIQSAMIETKKLKSLAVTQKQKETVDTSSKVSGNRSSNSSFKKSQIKEEHRKIEDFQGTLQSQFTNTIQTDYLKSGKEPQVLTTTMNKLDLLKNTLKNNPEAVLSNSFLACTLSMSTDPLLQSHKEEKHEVSATESFSFDFTKASSPASKEKLHEMQKSKQIKEKSPEEAGYDDDFEDYNENQDLNMRRQAELNSMLALYEQELAKQENFNAMSEGFKFRNKYLVMSEIKEQSYEGGSMISKNESLD